MEIQYIWISTLEKKHLTPSNNGIMIKFVGKKHMENKWVSRGESNGEY